jgi:hypothetical protein
MHDQQANTEDIKIADIDDIQLGIELESRTEKTQEEEKDTNTELCSTYGKQKSDERLPENQLKVLNSHSS